MNRSYLKRLQFVVKELKKYPLLTSSWLKENFTEIKDYTPYRWFYLQQLEVLLFFIKTPIRSGAIDFFSSDEDAIFEKWNKSEFADLFLKKLNQGKTLFQASQESIKLFDQHLVHLGNRHILRIESSLKNYRIQPSLGDVERSGKVQKMLETTLHLEKKELILMTPTLQEMKKYSHQIELALKIIKEASPDSWERFKSFTDVIIPIHQKEFVSYSHQELPGTSMINLRDRDFIDLIDDLLHENGHHHLNYYLNLEKLIDESIDNIYYSPWRRTLRPLRGVYHAYFTFFWAFKIFSDLASSNFKIANYDFNKEQQEKIFWRTVEEYYMLKYTYQELSWARKQGLINDRGWLLISEQQKILKRFSRKISLWEFKIGVHKKELKELKNTLKKALKDYQKN